MEKHETIALMTMGVFTIVLIWKMARRFAMPTQELAITRFLSVVGLAGLVWTGILGGRLMFDHAAGIPDSTLQAEMQNRTAGHEHAPGEEHDEPMGRDSASARSDTGKATTSIRPARPHISIEQDLERVGMLRRRVHAGHDAPVVRPAS
jgi:hypothetical protein